ncbi:regulatory protein, luxR family [Fodinibius roseus]|uniref:Regulatory protein, luxR family n=1 Tax=Fodinibius roseus TaxID=1194090 RepID=A0A1M5BM79_9BACT|nr:helix-turn-helix transcriptional regulator [Fodinibius roseus]SHF43515.1 regulatory protein, luxR family [Fodinibius roseus]
MDREQKSSNQPSEKYTQALLKLSSREGEVLKLIIEDKTTSEIANDLHLSVRTIENHRYRICKKLNLRGRGALKRWIENVKSSTS